MVTTDPWAAYIDAPVVDTNDHGSTSRNDAVAARNDGLWTPSPVNDSEIWERIAEQIDPPDVHWRTDPVRWAKERCQVELWSKQRLIVESVRDVPRVAVQSCHNTGKSFLAALATCWWIDSHAPGDAFVVTTAPTGAQVKAILWRNINHFHAANGLPGRTNLTEYYIGNEMVGMGRKPSEYDESAFQGIHALYVLVVLDEACGIPEDLWVAAETIASNTNSRILAIGNPDDPHSQFAHVCAEGSGWKTIEIGAWDTPNFTGEPVNERTRESLISVSWAEGRGRDWGVHSPLYTSKVLGKFPEDTEDSVIVNSWLSQCRRVDGLFADVDHRVAGLDVGAGGDMTVFQERVGRRAGRKWAKRTKDPMELVGQIVQHINSWGIERVIVDVIGVGWGIYGRLRELSRQNYGADPAEVAHDALIIPFNSGESANNSAKFINKRAELWWEVGRELSRTQGWDLTTIDDETAVELTAPKYKLNSRGKIQVEAKEEIKKRIGRSTDNADALLMAFLDETRQGFVVGSAMAEARI